MFSRGMYSVSMVTVGEVPLWLVSWGWHNCCAWDMVFTHVTCKDVGTKSGRLQNHRGLEYLTSERNELIHGISVGGPVSMTELEMAGFLFILAFLTVQWNILQPAKQHACHLLCFIMASTVVLRPCLSCQLTSWVSESLLMENKLLSWWLRIIWLLFLVPTLPFSLFLSSGWAPDKQCSKTIGGGSYFTGEAATFLVYTVSVANSVTPL